MTQNALKEKPANMMGVTVIRPHDYSVSDAWNIFTLSVKIIISSVFVVLKRILSMEIKKKMWMAWPTAVHFCCGSGADPCSAYLLPFFPAGSKQSLPTRRVLLWGKTGYWKERHSSDPRRTSGVVPGGVKQGTRDQYKCKRRAHSEKGRILKSAFWKMPKLIGIMQITSLSNVPYHHKKQY